MVYLKSVLAGIGGSILALILFTIGIVILNILNRNNQNSGLVGINVLGPLPISIAAVGFIIAFYLVYRNSN